MAYVEVIEVQQYHPGGVKQIIARGGGCYIGLIDESTVLKYPRRQGETGALEIECQLLEILGTHPRIIAYKGQTNDGLRLEYAPNGDLGTFILANPDTHLSQRLRWCEQAAEAVAYCHQKGIIHCDINLRNFLLDKSLDLKLADFQGMYKARGGKVLLDGLSRECTKSFLPRIHGDYADVKTDLFALGSAIHFIITGHEVFPELDSDKDEDEIEKRFQNGQFPIHPHACNGITSKCWTQAYRSAQEVIEDIRVVQKMRG
jgi:serine/threonine protein kinase